MACGLPRRFAPRNNSVLLRKIVVEPGYNHLKGYGIGVTIAVTPILSLGFCGAKSDARYHCGHQKACPTNWNLSIYAERSYIEPLLRQGIQ